MQFTINPCFPQFLEIFKSRPGRSILIKKTKSKSSCNSGRANNNGFRILASLLNRKLHCRFLEGVVAEDLMEIFSPPISKIFFLTGRFRTPFNRITERTDIFPFLELLSANWTSHDFSKFLFFSLSFSLSLEFAFLSFVFPFVVLPRL